MSGERGLFFLPVVLMLAITVSAVMLLTPSLDREEFLEARRIQREQARAAAEAALALAVHRREAVDGLDLGRARATATFETEGTVVTVEAEGRVPSFRNTHVVFTLTEKFVRAGDGTLALPARD